MKIIRTPEIKWEPIDNLKGHHRLMFFGRVNIGSPHETYSTWYGIYDSEVSGKYFDMDMDSIGGVEATHYLKIKIHKT